MRYFIEFSYNGSNYHGWQIQPNASSVQQTLNETLTTILRHEIATTGAGRTDAGVHATQMFAHFDCHAIHDLDKLVYKLNSLLPIDIAVHNLIPVADDAHARFDATSRCYEYHMHTKKDVFTNSLSWYYQKSLDVDAMNEAAKVLIGRQDFQCFSKSNTDVSTYFCDVSKAMWTQKQNGLIFTIEADRFLRNMVRAIVGTLIDVGVHKIDLDQLKFIIANKNRNDAGVSVPAHGLFLTQIKYPYIK